MKTNPTNLPRRACLWLSLAALSVSLAIPAVAGEKEKTKGTANHPYTLAELAKGIDQLQKQEIVVSGTIIGACKSGCKMWIADGKYRDGDRFALVRAKDDAFKFDTGATGKIVKLHGYAVAELMDYCAERGGEKKAEAQGGKKECAGPEGANMAITFFATEVNYGG